MAIDVGSAVGYLLLDTSKWDSGISKAKQGFKTLWDDTATTSDKLTAVGSSFTSLGTTLTIGVTAPLAGLGAGMVKTAKDWESAWTGVLKTVDATPEELKKIEKGLFDISKRTASTPEEIAAVAEAAGQLGIASEDVLDFTEVMVMLGDTTNLTSEEAATNFARFANIVGMSSDDYERLGAVVVDLGNNFATTEQEITDMAMRLAGSGSQIGLSESQIFGISTALSSVGIEAEAGGSSFSKLMGMMQLSVETGNEQLEQFASVAGMTSEQFVQAFEEDAAGAITAFIEGLGNMDENGQSAIATLGEMDITEVRMRDTLLRAAGASDVFKDAIDTAGAAWENNTALTEEAQKRYETFEAKLQQLKNAIKEAAIQFGDILIPKIEDVIDWIGDLVNKFAELTDEQKENALKWAGIAAAVGPALVAFGKVSKIAGDVVKVMGELGGVGGIIGKVKSAFDFLGGAAQGVAVLIQGAGGIGPALAGLASGPIGWVILAIGLLAAAWATDFGGIREFTAEVFSSIGEIIQSAVNIIKEIIQIALDIIKAIWENDFMGIRTKVEVAMTAIKTILETAFELIKNVIQNALNIIKDIFHIFEAIFKGDWEGAWEAIKQYFADVWKLIGNLLRDALNILIDTIVNVAAKLYEAALKAFNKVKDGFSDAWNKVKEWFDKAKEDPVKAITDLGKSLFDAGVKAINSLLEGFVQAWNSIVSWVTEKVDWIKGKFASARAAANGMTSSQTPSGGDPYGFHAAGLDYVQREGTVYVHEGEGILTKQENAAYRSGRGRGGDTINIYSPTALSPVKVAAEYKRAKQELALGYI